ncbi:WD repeat-containing protein 70 [Liparis tanakae]|uniref:WD repeat-containing protein 70 n=1 Tax=Liparis tanakae TaxID=230148 RepID=A0A4Z2IUQ2_9TELE|nr:WD repeat-containing protein 70 [Liparis tanakae]
MSDDGEIASVMGFSGFGKKARTFDLEAIFEQTRRTAIERSQQVLEERQMEDHMEQEGESSKSVKSSLPALKDKAAADTSSSDSGSDSDSELIGPPLPPQLTAQGDDSLTRDDEDDDDDEGESEDDDDDVCLK